MITPPILTPTVTAVSPASGTTLGGQTVTISGNNFTAAGAGTPSVVIGGAACTNVRSVTNTSLQCTTSARAAGSVGITVTTAGGSGSGGTFAYISPPTISGISPASGPHHGGTDLTVSGNNFQSGGTLNVTIGGTACTRIVVTSNTQLRCSTPARAAGAAAVQLSNTLGQSSTINFTYQTINPPNTTAPRGWIDRVSLVGSTVVIGGWACVPGYPASISVHIYFGGRAGIGSNSFAVLANQDSGTDLQPHCGSIGARYRFSVNLTDAQRNANRGRGVWGHGINPAPGADNSAWDLQRVDTLVP